METNEPAQRRAYGGLVPAERDFSIDWVSAPDVAYNRFKAMVDRSEVIHARVAQQQNMISVTLTFKQYHVASGQEMYHAYSVFVTEPEADLPPSTYSCQPYMGHKSEFMAFNDDGTMVASLEEGRGGQFFAIGLSGRGLVFGMDFAGNTAISKIYRPLDDFGAFEWSPDGRCLLVVIKPGTGPGAVESIPTTFSQIMANRKFSDKTGMGEGLSDIENFGVAVIQLQSPLVFGVKIPKDVLPSQFTWGRDNRSFYFVGTNVDPAYCLGLRYCTNRPTTIYQAKCVEPRSLAGPWDVSPFVDGQGEGFALHSPRVSPNGEYLIFTKNAIFGPHNHCRSVWIIKITDGRGGERVVVEQVRDRGPHSSTPYLPARYTGLYEDLPERCWTGDSKSVVFSASAGFCRHMYVLFVDPEIPLERRMFYIEPPVRRQTEDSGVAENGCWTVKTVYSNKVVSVYSSCSTCCEIFLGTIKDRESPGDGCPVTFSWLLFLEGKPYFDDIQLVGRILSYEVPRPSGESAGHDFDTSGILEESFLLSVTKRRSDAPTLVCVHGGPNSSFHDNLSDDQYAPYTFAACGFNVLQLNYVGSTGYGQKSLEYLTGHVTQRDVDSCLRLLEAAISEHRLNRNLLLYYGGSHAGAIGLHIMARYPELFVAATLRNPVCDYVTMLASSDIPDYVFCQVLNRTFERNFTFDADTVKQLMSKSPLANVERLRTPLLLLLGSHDLRVPCHAAIRLKQMLQARNVPCEARVYPQGHAIKEYLYTQDAFVHSYNWFIQHLQKKLYGFAPD